MDGEKKENLSEDLVLFSQSEIACLANPNKVNMKTKQKLVCLHWILFALTCQHVKQKTNKKSKKLRQSQTVCEVTAFSKSEFIKRAENCVQRPSSIDSLLTAFTFIKNNRSLKKHLSYIFQHLCLQEKKTKAFIFSILLSELSQSWDATGLGLS